MRFIATAKQSCSVHMSLANSRRNCAFSSCVGIGGVFLGSRLVCLLD
jgi:hypothetical protein